MEPDLETDLRAKIEDAQRSETNFEFFKAAIQFREALILAKRLNNKEIIIYSKNKHVEMNKKSIESGKDFHRRTITQNIPEDRVQAHEKFISEFLGRKKLDEVLKNLGRHPAFFPNKEKLKQTTIKSVPLTFQIASISTISDSGHTIRGSSDGLNAWFHDLYKIQLQLVTQLCTSRVIKELMEPMNGFDLNFESLFGYFEKSDIYEQTDLVIISTGLKSFFAGDYISAMHVLVPRFESTFLKLSEKLGIDIVAADRVESGATQTKTLSERDLNSETFQQIWTQDLCQLISFTLYAPLGLQFRHKIAHGEIHAEDCTFENVCIVLHLFLSILGRIEKKTV